MQSIRLAPLSLAVILASTPFTLIQPVSAGGCVDLNHSQAMTLEGVLTHQIFPGPPNYEDVRTGDQPEPAYILRLRESVCVSGDDIVGANQQIDRVQIFPKATDNAALWNALRQVVGKSVVVEGTSPFAAHTGHHHAPLLLPIRILMPK